MHYASEYNDDDDDGDDNSLHRDSLHYTNKSIAKEGKIEISVQVKSHMQGALQSKRASKQASRLSIDDGTCFYTFFCIYM